MKAQQVNGLRNTPRSAFNAIETRSQLDIEKLWEKAQEIIENTLACIETSADENAWSTHVAQNILEWETLGLERKCVRPTFSRTENMRVLSTSRVRTLAH